ncbi:29 kDa protein [Persimmon virus B]|uniref:29 kDa protein n=1 Tax=Persimmon virus B TaxID=1493829 RepID=A0A0A8JBS5_9CLOS|nr:29 kDa protein [Persimmon virus B]BAQ08209.1 29 kDa protein [Persimmon virus B]
MSLTRICLRKAFVQVLAHMVMLSLLMLLRQGSGEIYGKVGNNPVHGGCFFWDDLGNNLGTVITSNKESAVRYHVSRNYSKTCGAGNTLVEWTYKDGIVYYDISCVDGFSCAVVAKCNDNDVFYSYLDSYNMYCRRRNDCGECLSNCISEGKDDECCLNNYTATVCNPQWSQWLWKLYNGSFKGIYTYAYDDDYGLHQCTNQVLFTTQISDKHDYSNPLLISSSTKACINSVDRYLGVIFVAIVKEVFTKLISLLL